MRYMALIIEFCANATRHKSFSHFTLGTKKKKKEINRTSKNLKLINFSIISNTLEIKNITRNIILLLRGNNVHVFYVYIYYTNKNTIVTIRAFILHR